ncbi:hypothetical protein AGMMS49941_04250 [Deferribacterales bacterium]|nr:hypothetical protein AGMMS49941_04250 [Deferribacterales bacterium]
MQAVLSDILDEPVEYGSIEDISFLPNLTTKDLFLANLRSPSGKIRYKRYIGSPLRYPGGKSLAVGLILEHLPSDVRRVVSPFFGGGSVEIACSKELDVEVIGYDVFDILANYWQVQISQPEVLYKKLSELKPTKDEYARIKQKLKQHWDGVLKLEPLELAMCYYFNHNLSYGPGFLGWMSSIYEDETRYRLAIEKVRKFNPNNLNVFCDVFENVIPKHSDDFLYCDPPYYLEGDSKMFHGIYPQRNFPVHHNNFNHALLAEMLKAHKGGFILSYNDCSAVREMYSGYKIIDVAWQYTLGQGETRIGKNRIENGTNTNVKRSHEILILGV